MCTLARKDPSRELIGRPTVGKLTVGLESYIYFHKFADSRWFSQIFAGFAGVRNCSKRKWPPEFATRPNSLVQRVLLVKWFPSFWLSD